MLTKEREGRRRRNGNRKEISEHTAAKVTEVGGE